MANPSTRRLPEVQGLRAVAVVLVVAYHAGLPLPGGFTGVDVFFVISGFVITRLLWREGREHGRVRLRTFYGRRIRRLLPALSLVLVVVLVASALLESPIEAQGNTAFVAALGSFWLANAGLFLTTSGYFAADTHPVLLHTWSLAVEEQFYLVFPALIALALAAGLRWRARVAFLLISLTLVGSLGIELLLTYAAPAGFGTAERFAFFSPMTRAWEFAIGALVALTVTEGARRTPRIAAGVAGSGLLLVLLGAFAFDGRTTFPGVAALIPACGTALIIVGCLLGTNPVGRLLATRPATWLGDISYSWYLWHWPFITFGILLWGESVPVTALAALLSLPVAWASFRWVEQPIRNRARFRVPAPVLLAASMAVVLTLAGVLFVGSSRYWGDRDIEAMADQVLPKTAWLRCQTAVPLPERDLDSCTQAGDDRPPVVLLGDSNAGQYADGLALAARRADRTLVVAVSPGCPLSLVEIWQAGRPGGCAERAESTLRWVAGHAPVTVVLASSTAAVDDPDYQLQAPGGGRRVSGTAAKADLWGRALRRTLGRLQQAGATVVRLESIPTFVSDGVQWRPSSCSMLDLLSGPDACGRRTPLAAARRAQQAALTVEHEAVDKAGVRTLDLVVEVCPEGRCATNLGDFWVYRDGLHITRAMSRSLAPALAPVFTRTG